MVTSGLLNIHTNIPALMTLVIIKNTIICFRTFSFGSIILSLIIYEAFGIILNITFFLFLLKNFQLPKDWMPVNKKKNMAADNLHVILF